MADIIQIPSIYTENVCKYRDPELFKRVYDALPDYRRRKIDSMALEKNKCLSMGAEILLRRALTDSGFDAGRYEPSFEANGKAYFPAISGVFQFNLSHCGDMAMCAAHRGPQSIGCDIEKIKDIDLNIAGRRFCRSEYETIMSQKTKREQIEYFFRFWTLKESFMKATGLGLSLPLNEFEIRIKDDGDISVSQNVDHNNYRFDAAILPDGYVYAWCMAIC